MLRADNLSHQRNGIALFSAVSFNVMPTEMVKIVGGNGCGKTTLLKILCRLLPPDEGAVTWQDPNTTDDDSDNDDDTFREQTLLVGHHNALADDLTPLENLHAAAGLRRRPPQLPPAQALAQAGISAVANRQCRQLSAGQRRRAALSRLRAFAANLWLLDEPLAALDTDGRAMLTRWLDDHLQSGGMAICTMHSPDDWPVPAARVINCRRA